MISKYAYLGQIWIDLDSPTEEELGHVMEEYSIPNLVGEEIRSRNIQSKVDLFPSFIYLVMHFPHVGRAGSHNADHEIDFIMGADFLITVHYGFIPSLHEFSKTFEVDAILEKKTSISHAGILFLSLIKTLYSHSQDQLRDIHVLLKETERKIFEATERKTVVMISNTNRMLLGFRQALRFHKSILNSFEQSAMRFYGESFAHHISLIHSEYDKTQAILDSHKEILDDLRDTNDSLLANRTNETMKILTIITFLLSPFTVISSIFMMNTDSLLISSLSDYYLVVGAMLLISIIIFIYFKKKKWL
ncbi:MAG: CorA family divalent cation transporter [Patescibacteria group bacterium]